MRDQPLDLILPGGSVGSMHMEDNIVMLGAILRRSILDGVEGASPWRAVEAATQRHAVLVAAGLHIHSRDANL